MLASFFPDPRVFRPVPLALARLGSDVGIPGEMRAASAVRFRVVAGALSKGLEVVVGRKDGSCSVSMGSPGRPREFPGWATEEKMLDMTACDAAGGMGSELKSELDDDFPRSPPKNSPRWGLGAILEKYGSSPIAPCRTDAGGVYSAGESRDPIPFPSPPTSTPGLLRKWLKKAASCSEARAFDVTGAAWSARAALRAAASSCVVAIESPGSISEVVSRFVSLLCLCGRGERKVDEGGGGGVIGFERCGSFFFLMLNN